MKKTLCLIIYCLVLLKGFTQVIEIDNLKNMKAKDLLKFNGGISANSIFYTGNGETNRQPFTYFINGMLNIKVAGLIDVPLSFNLTNTGKSFNLPTTPSRIGLHPKYKSITGHLGDVSMVFSPYTLNGYQFRGAGVDVEPTKGKLSVSAMAGRLQKATEYDSANQIVPAAYERFGYGVKLGYKEKYYRLGLIVFTAKDKVNSLQFKPDSLSIFPKQNVVLGLSGAYTPAEGIEISMEYANSALTNDLRDTFKVSEPGKNFLGSLVNRNNSTAFFKALKGNVNYKYKNSTLGVGYERIDPGYETLGAYYFSNDLENITVNIAQPFARNKGQLSANVGVQRDNLDDSKMSSSRRIVYAVTSSYMPTPKLMTTFNFSNFTTYQRIRPVFENLNQSVTPYSNLDTLNYSQVSSNANANVNYIFQQTEKKMQSINTNVNFLTVSDRQGGIKQFGANSQLLSVAGSYTLTLIPKGMSFTAAFNTTTNKVGGTKYMLYGPTLSLSNKLFKKVNSVIVTAYNAVSGGTLDGSSILNTRINLGYTFNAKQNFNLSFNSQLRRMPVNGTKSDIIVTAGYNFFF